MVPLKGASMARVLSERTLAEIEKLCSRYPTRQAALLPSLHLTQDEHGYIPDDAALDLADALDIPPTRVSEVVTFYTMFYDRPVGRNVVKICRNLACRLRGSDRIIELAKEKLGIDLGGTTDDGRVTLETDECLASCGTGPMLWCRSRPDDGEVSERIVENLDEKKLEAFLAELK